MSRPCWVGGSRQTSSSLMLCARDRVLPAGAEGGGRVNELSCRRGLVQPDHPMTPGSSPNAPRACVHGFCAGTWGSGHCRPLWRDTQSGYSQGTIHDDPHDRVPVQPQPSRPASVGRVIPRACPPKIVILREGPRRIIVAADSVWDDVFAPPASPVPTAINPRRMSARCGATI